MNILVETNNSKTSCSTRMLSRFLNHLFISTMLKFPFQNHLNVILDFRLNFELEVLKKLENLLPIFALIALFNPFSPVML